MTERSAVDNGNGGHPAYCPCGPCVRQRAGVGWGPYTPAEFLRLQAARGEPAAASSGAPRVDNDPAVVAAAAAVVAALPAYEAARELWLDVLGKQREADLLVTSQDLGVADRGRNTKPLLAEREGEAHAVMQRAWPVVVAAQERERLARIRARAAA